MPSNLYYDISVFLADVIILLFTAVHAACDGLGNSVRFFLAVVDKSCIRLSNLSFCLQSTVKDVQ